MDFEIDVKYKFVLRHWFDSNSDVQIEFENPKKLIEIYSKINIRHILSFII